MWWSYLLTAVGLTGFILAGRKVASAVYTVVFTQNAVAWTREHRVNRPAATTGREASDA